MSTKQLPTLPIGYHVFARDGEFVWWHCEGPGLPKPPRAYAYPSALEAASACWAAARKRLDSAPPRDELKPPPGWRATDGSVSPEWVARQTCVTTLAEAWRIYDTEHGYTPTEAPRSEPTDQGRARALELLREANGCLDDGDNQAAAGECIRAAISALTGEPCAGS